MSSASRRKIHWDRLRGPRDWIAFFIATGGGSGLSPFAPGTAGSVPGLLLCFFLMPRLSPALYWAFWAGLLFVGIWAAGHFCQRMQTQDHQAVVIDEILGMAVTTAFLPSNAPLQAWVFCFFAFRVFDVLKIPPVRQLDRWSKRAQTLGSIGFGVIADDLLAGLQALGIGWLFARSGLLGY
jgi:phosphatidylglycerophosphatase A